MKPGATVRRCDIIEQVVGLELHRRVFARCPTNVDLHCHIELDEFFVNRVKSLVARIEVVVRGIELAGAESMLLDAALNFPERTLVCRGTDRRCTSMRSVRERQP